MAIGIRDGRWALSRIVQEDAHGWTTSASLKRLAGGSAQNFYPPSIPTAQGGGCRLPWALVRLEGVPEADPDTILLPDLRPLSTLRDLSQPQRNALRTALESRLGDYAFTDYDGTVRTLQAFSGAGFTLDTTWAAALRAVFAHLAHSDVRPRASLRQPHNTQYLDDFSTDPSSRWTAYASSSYSWDSGNSELDFNTTQQTQHRYSANSPGSIEQECQVTASEVTRTPYASVRNNSTSCYSIYSNNDNNFVLARWEDGTRYTLASPSYTRSSGDFMTWRLAAEGVAGANVTLSYWRTGHGATKPSDPGWIGTDGSPDGTYTDTAATRLDDSGDIYCGIEGRAALSDVDTRNCFWKSRAISDRGGGASYNDSVTFAAAGAFTQAGVASAVATTSFSASAGVTQGAALAVAAALAYNSQAAVSPSVQAALAAALDFPAGAALTPAAQLAAGVPLGFSAAAGVDPAGQAAASSAAVFSAAAAHSHGVQLVASVSSAFEALAALLVSDGSTQNLFESVGFSAAAAHQVTAQAISTAVASYAAAVGLAHASAAQVAEALAIELQAALGVGTQLAAQAQVTLAVAAALLLVDVGSGDISYDVLQIASETLRSAGPTGQTLASAGATGETLTPAAPTGETLLH